ncbi:MAG: host attachment protein [Sphingomonadales bacterium]|nr:host attachment protein [Sphingomonadales bacterium]
MKLPAQTHVAVVDGERFLLMRNCGTTADPTLEVIAQPSVPETNKSAGQHEHESAHRRGGEPHDRAAHAAGVADWLNHEVLTHRIESLLVVADPTTLGEMRRHYHKQTEAALLGELDKQLTGMPGPDIMKAIEAA